MLPLYLDDIGHGSKVDTRHSRRLYTGYKSSSDLCQDKYQQWWIAYYIARSEHLRALNTKLEDTLIDKYREILLLIGPAEPYDDGIGPVQSVHADYGVLLDPRRPPQIVTDRDCFTTCEDRRPPYELWLSESRIFLVKPGKQSRDKTPYNMRCSEGQIASIEDRPDLRWRATDDLVKVITEAIRKVDSMYIGEDSYKSTRRQSRAVGGPIQQCFCRAAPNRAPSEAQCIDTYDIDGFLEDLPSPKRMTIRDFATAVDLVAAYSGNAEGKH